MIKKFSARFARGGPHFAVLSLQPRPQGLLSYYMTKGPGDEVVVPEPPKAFNSPVSLSSHVGMCANFGVAFCMDHFYKKFLEWDLYEILRMQSIMKRKFWEWNPFLQNLSGVGSSEILQMHRSRTNSNFTVVLY